MFVSFVLLNGYIISNLWKLAKSVVYQSKEISFRYVENQFVAVLFNYLFALERTDCGWVQA